MRFRTDFGLGRRSFRSIGHMTFGQLDSVKYSVEFRPTGFDQTKQTDEFLVRFGELTAGHN